MTEAGIDGSSCAVNIDNRWSPSAIIQVAANIDTREWNLPVTAEVTTKGASHHAGLVPVPDTGMIQAEHFEVQGSPA